MKNMKPINKMSVTELQNEYKTLANTILLLPQHMRGIKKVKAVLAERLWVVLSKLRMKLSLIGLIGLMFITFIMPPLAFATDRASIEVKHSTERGLGHSALFDHAAKPTWGGQTSRTNNRSLETLLTLPTSHNVSLLLGYKRIHTSLVLPVSPAFFGFKDDRKTTELSVGLRVYLSR